MTTYHRPMPVSPPTPPTMRRTMISSLHVADSAWREMMDFVRASATTKSPLRGAWINLHMRMVLEQIVDDPALLDRVLQHVNQRVLADAPRPTGRLL